MGIAASAVIEGNHFSLSYYIAASKNPTKRVNPVRSYYITAH